MPPETAYFLAQVAPVLTPDQRTRVQAYLRKFQQRFPFLTTPAIGTYEGRAGNTTSPRAPPTMNGWTARTR